MLFPFSFLQSQSSPLLLDLYPSAAAAYSVRKLRTAYTGSAIRVRRTDLTESDIGFTGLGNLDTAALLSFTGTGALDNGFITTWYDQSGNARNATQTTALNQPQIVSSGSVITETFIGSSKPSVQFTTLSQLPFDNTIAKDIGELFIKTVSSHTGGDAYRAIVNFTTDGTSFNTRSGIFARSSANLEAGGRRLDINSYEFVNSSNNASKGILGGFFDYTNANLSVSVNSTTTQRIGGFQTPGNTSNTNAQINTIGSTGAGVNFAGKISEVVIWLSDESSNNTNINTNLNTYYEIY